MFSVLNLVLSVHELSYFELKLIGFVGCAGGRGDQSGGNFNCDKTFYFQKPNYQ